jgi:hypothetical protein
MDVDQPTASSSSNGGQGREDYVYFERHPEMYEGAKAKAQGMKMKLEHHYKDGVEMAVARRERYVVVVFLRGGAMGGGSVVVDRLER